VNLFDLAGNLRPNVGVHAWLKLALSYHKLGDISGKDLNDVELARGIVTSGLPLSSHHAKAAPMVRATGNRNFRFMNTLILRLVLIQNSPQARQSPVCHRGDVP
jgi:hypothetical protein